MSKWNHVVTIALLAAPGAVCIAQGEAKPPAGEVALDARFIGKYDFSFVPNNGEGITGQLEVSFKSGQYHGVFTSPKLQEPLDADSVHVAGSHFFTSGFGGSFTFAFDLDGTKITNAVFTKSMNGATEQGSLSIKKVVR
jgi:hypothetical protein